MGAVAYKVYYGIGKNSELNWETFYGGRVGGGGGGEEILTQFPPRLWKKKKRFFHQNGLIVQSEAATVQSRRHVPPHNRDL